MVIPCAAKDSAAFLLPNGMFTRFVPNTQAGEDAWREMAKDDGCAAVLNIHATAVIAQLRRAGYTVLKAKKTAEPTMAEVDTLLSELGI